MIISSSITNGQDTGRKALLVIDVQENLLNPGSKIHIDTTDIDSFLSNLNKSVRTFKSNNLEVIYVVNEWTNPVKNWLTGNVCKKGGEGTCMDKRIELVSDRTFSKSKPDALSDIELLEFLKNKSITDLYIAGLLAEGCVKGTVNGAIEENFRVTVIEDALGSKSMKKKANSITIFKRNGVRIIKTRELNRCLASTGI
jgi:nicotinamidase-related amidase